MMRRVDTPKNGLGDVDLKKAEPLKRRRDGKPPLKKKRSQKVEIGRTRLGKEINEVRGRKPPVRIKGRSLKEIHEMDPDDPIFKHPDGGKRKYQAPVEELTFEEARRLDGLKRKRARRARARKYETEVVAAVEIMDKHTTSKQNSEGIYDEDLAVAEAILNLDEWDNEELIRGYRRGRGGNFGKPPKYIPREVQQQAFRILIGRGDGILKKAYIQSLEVLVDLALNANSEKVKLDAVKEIEERVVGKVPDRVHVGVEQPWEGILADSLVPISEVAPLDLTMDDDGVARMLPGDVAEVETDTRPLPSGAVSRAPSATKRRASPKKGAKRAPSKD